jgi:hypothetical protein
MCPEKKENRSHHGTVSFERRRHPRFNVDLPMDYDRIGSAISHDGRTPKPGEGGLLVYVSEWMEIGQRLNMTLFFDCGSGLETIKALAEIVWKDAHFGNESGEYRCGVNLIDISPEDKTKLENCLKDLSR